MCWGDSLTEGYNGFKYPPLLAALRPLDIVLNEGIGGQKSTQIAMRQGGVATKLTIQNNEIVAGDNVVTAINGVTIIPGDTAQDPDYRLLSNRAQYHSTTGTVAGVSGTLAASGTSTTTPTTLTYTFTPSAISSPVMLTSQAPFIVTPIGDNASVAIIWSGRNNYNYPAQVKSDIAAMVATLKSTKYIILSVTNSDNSYEYYGTSGWRIITTLNSDLAALYPENYLDIRSILVAYGAPGQPYANPTDYAHDIPPAGLRSDQYHPNAAGHQIVAQSINDFLTAKGW